jgi:hypothetical protein
MNNINYKEMNTQEPSEDTNKIMNNIKIKIHDYCEFYHDDAYKRESYIKMYIHKNIKNALEKEKYDLLKMIFDKYKKYFCIIDVLYAVKKIGKLESVCNILFENLDYSYKDYSYKISIIEDAYDGYFKCNELNIIAKSLMLQSCGFSIYFNYDDSDPTTNPIKINKTFNVKFTDAINCGIF